MPVNPAPLNPDLHRLHVLRLFRQVMPSVAGVVLATEDGVLLTHDVDEAADPQGIARDGFAARAPEGKSTLVTLRDHTYLVVFVPPAFSLMWRTSEALAPEGFAGPGPLPQGMAA